LASKSNPCNLIGGECVLIGRESVSILEHWIFWTVHAQNPWKNSWRKMHEKSPKTTHRGLPDRKK